MAYLIEEVLSKYNCMKLNYSTKFSSIFRPFSPKEFSTFKQESPPEKKVRWERIINK